MEIYNWIDILFAVTGLPALVIMIRTAINLKSLSSLFFGLSVFSFLIGVSLGYFDQIDRAIAREWGDLVAITFTLCALFVKTRNSKPIFARFPLIMTLLPLIGIVFYPMINDAMVVKDLLQITYQGGAIIVGLLVISINQLMYKQRGILLSACFIFLASYILFWYIPASDEVYYQIIALVLFALGIIIAAIGFRRVVVVNQSIKIS